MRGMRKEACCFCENDHIYSAFTVVYVLCYCAKDQDNTMSSQMYCYKEDDPQIGRRHQGLKDRYHQRHQNNQVLFCRSGAADVDIAILTPS